MVYVMEQSYNCLAPGQIVAVSVKNNSDTYRGTIICQPYSAICGVGESERDIIMLVGLPFSRNTIFVVVRIHLSRYLVYF